MEVLGEFWEVFGILLECAFSLAAGRLREWTRFHRIVARPSFGRGRRIGAWVSPGKSQRMLIGAGRCWEKRMAPIYYIPGAIRKLSGSGAKGTGRFNRRRARRLFLFLVTIFQVDPGCLQSRIPCPKYFQAAPTSLRFSLKTSFSHQRFILPMPFLNCSNNFFRIPFLVFTDIHFSRSIPAAVRALPQLPNAFLAERANVRFSQQNSPHTSERPRL